MPDPYIRFRDCPFHRLVGDERKRCTQAVVFGRFAPEVTCPQSFPAPDGLSVRRADPANSADMRRSADYSLGRWPRGRRQG